MPAARLAVVVERSLLGTPPETGGRARAAAVVVLAGIALLAGAAAVVSPAAQARPQSVCCFRVTVEVTGEVQTQYTRVDPIDDQGLYFYKWEGTAYGLAHLQGSVLVTDRAVAAGFLAEQNGVTDGEGRPRDRNEPGCSQGEMTGPGRYELGKTRHGSPFIWLGRLGAFAFDRPFEDWELKCGSLATEALDRLEEDNAHWDAPRGFFNSVHIKGLSARQLAGGGSLEVTCVEQSKPPAEPRMLSHGFSADSIKIVHFPADDLKHQQHRLAGFLGERRDPDEYSGRHIDKLNNDFFTGRHVPGNGCHTG